MTSDHVVYLGDGTPTVCVYLKYLAAELWYEPLKPEEKEMLRLQPSSIGTMTEARFDGDGMWLLIVGLDDSQLGLTHTLRRGTWLVLRCEEPFPWLTREQQVFGRLEIDGVWTMALELTKNAFEGAATSIAMFYVKPLSEAYRRLSKP